MGEQALFESSDDHRREFQSLRRVHCHQPDARFTRSRFLVHLRQERQAIDEATERRFGVVRLVVSRGGHQLHQVLDALVGFLGVLLAEIVQVARLIEHLPNRDRNGVRPGGVRE